MGLLHEELHHHVCQAVPPNRVAPSPLVMKEFDLHKNGGGEEGRVAGAPPRPPPTSAAASQLLFKYLLTLHLTPASLGRAAVTNLHKQY